jgi:hypothetical protein
MQVFFYFLSDILLIYFLAGAYVCLLSAGDTWRPHRARPHCQEAQHRPAAQNLALLRQERIQVSALVIIIIIIIIIIISPFVGPWPLF